MTSLYELSTQYESALVKLTDSGLDEETINDTLEGLEGELEEKAINVSKFAANLEAEAAMVDQAIKQMKYRADALKKKSARMRQYLLENMNRAGITSISCPYFEIKVKTNPPSVVVDDEAAIPHDYITEKVVRSVNKTAVKAAIKAGTEVPGAHLQNSKRVEVK